MQMKLLHTRNLIWCNREPQAIRKVICVLRGVYVQMRLITDSLIGSGGVPIRWFAVVGSLNQSEVHVEAHIELCIGAIWRELNFIRVTFVTETLNSKRQERCFGVYCTGVYGYTEGCTEVPWIGGNMGCQVFEHNKTHHFTTSRLSQQVKFFHSLIVLLFILLWFLTRFYYWRANAKALDSC